jgi:hypothetical protein
MELLDVLKKRFEKNMHRHEGLVFEEVQEKLIQHLDTILKMEQSGGEPDVVVLEDKLYVIDMVKESPKLRGSLCYDKEARLARKNFPPASSALEMAASLGISVIDEMMYVKLQDIEDFDLKTSSWILTDDKLRSLGGALFGDKRYQRTFIYHNGADSYYGSRGFRGYITL